MEVLSGVTKRPGLGHELGMGSQIRTLSTVITAMGVVLGGCIALTTPENEGGDATLDGSVEVDGGLGDPGVEAGPTTNSPSEGGVALDGGSAADTSAGSEDAGPSDDGGSVDDGGPVLDGGSSDSGSVADAGDAGPSPGVTCSYRLEHTHAGSCDALCGVPPRKPLPAEELVVMEDVAITTQTGSGCAPLVPAPQPQPGKRVAEIHADLVFSMFLNMSRRFQLTGSPPLETFVSPITATKQPCVNNPLRTSGTISVKIIDGDQATVNLKVTHAPLTDDYCGINSGCLRQVLECKGSTTATVLP